MNIVDICADYIKIGKTSITVKGENGKTKGIVKNCTTFPIMTPRDMNKLHDSKIPLEECRNCIIQNGDIYYLHNNFLANWINQQKHPEIFTNEIAKVERLKKVAESMRDKGIIVIECSFE